MILHLCLICQPSTSAWLPRCSNALGDSHDRCGLYLHSFGENRLQWHHLGHGLHGRLDLGLESEAVSHIQIGDLAQVETPSRSKPGTAATKAGLDARALAACREEHDQP